MTPSFDVDVDARDLLCPLPVLRARKALQSMRPGQVLRLTATDAMARIDLPHFCAGAGHRVVSESEDQSGLTFFIRCGG